MSKVFFFLHVKVENKVYLIYIITIPCFIATSLTYGPFIQLAWIYETECKHQIKAKGIYK